MFQQKKPPICSIHEPLKTLKKVIIFCPDIGKDFITNKEILSKHS